MGAMLDVFVIVSLILAIIAGAIACFAPQHGRLVGAAVALIAVAMLLPHF